MKALLQIEDLRVVFRVGRRRLLRAVAGVDLVLGEGESLGLVGESGCGKSTLGRTVIGQESAESGRVLFRGRNCTGLRGGALKAFRKEVQMVFQDPFGSLNPRMTVGACLSEVLRVHGLDAADGGGPRARAARRRERVAELLESVGLEPDYAGRYPHEFSGGQRQRIGLARALAVGPSVIIADEPVSALDVSVQVQILNLMRSLQSRFGLSYLFIAHDLAVVRYMCPRIQVMYLGRIVESGRAEELFERPAHPYTEALLSAVPDVDKGLRGRAGGSSRIVLRGDVPSPVEHIPGCPFHPRCHRVREICRREEPPPAMVGRGRRSRCHFASELAAGTT